MHPLGPLSGSMLERVREFRAGSATTVEPRDAATVVLLRDGADLAEGSLEVYLLLRHAGMAFASGMAVFPGGGVDPRDFDAGVGWAGPPPRDWAGLLGTDEPRARALVCAAVRETFEESGVLLAGTTDTAVVDDTTGADWERDRHRLENRELSLTDLLRQRGLVLRSDLLRFWGGWVTPAFEPRRFRTWFFAAALPAGQHTRDVSSESEHVTWSPVRDAVAAVDEGRMAMLPPQYFSCLELFDFPTPAEALASAGSRDRSMIEPTATGETDEGARLLLPERLVELAARAGRRAGGSGVSAGASAG